MGLIEDKVINVDDLFLAHDRYGDGWEALYYKGELVVQAESINLGDVLLISTRGYDMQDFKDGYFPPTLAECDENSKVKLRKQRAELAEKMAYIQGQIARLDEELK